MKPLAVDLCCGLGGWSHGLLAEGWDVVGFDIERHAYGEDRYPAQLVLQDIRTLDGRQFKGKVSLIVASPPCQEYSYMAMPWSRAKAIAAEYWSGVRDVRKLTELFDACVRIGREAECPIVIENVRGAQPWVGRSRWNFGSYHLWGDVPALMPMTKRVLKGRVLKGGWQSQAGAPMRRDDGVKVQGFSFDGSGKSFKTASVEGMKTTGHANIRDGHPHTRHLTNQAESMCDDRDRGVKGYTPNVEPLGKNQMARKHGSKSKARKAASAAIAKIPLTLSRYIAAHYKPPEAA